jgi:hypothetical protein
VRQATEFNSSAEAGEQGEGSARFSPGRLFTDQPAMMVDSLELDHAHVLHP